jgi:hypothetical protein
MQPTGSSPCAQHPQYTLSHPYNLISFNVHLGLPSALIPSGLSTKTLYTFVFHTCHVSRPSTLLDLITRILYYFARSIKLWSSSLRNFLQRSVTSTLLGPNTFLSTLLSISLSLFCFLDVRDRFHRHKTTGKITVVSAAIFRLAYGTHY